MNKPINERIKQIRDFFANGSNNEFAQLMGEKPNTTSNWVSGSRNIGIDVIEKIKKNLPSVNIDWLISGEGDMISTKKKEELDISNGILKTNLNVKMIPLVGQYAHAGYLNGFADEEYVDELPTIPILVDHEIKGDYRAFEIRGDSMDDGSSESVLEGEIAVGRNIHFDYWRYKLHINKWNFIIVHKEDGIIIKRIIDHDVERGLITVHSLNPLYPDKVISLADVAQLYNVVQVLKSGRL